MDNQWGVQNYKDKLIRPWNGNGIKPYSQATFFRKNNECGQGRIREEGMQQSTSKIFVGGGTLLETGNKVQ